MPGISPGPLVGPGPFCKPTVDLSRPCHYHGGMVLDFNTALTYRTLSARALAQAAADRERNERADIAEQIDKANEALRHHETDPSRP